MEEESLAPQNLRWGSIGSVCLCQAWENTEGLGRGSRENLVGLETRPVVGEVLGLGTSSLAPSVEIPGRSTGDSGKPEWTGRRGEQTGTFSSRALWCSNSDLRAFSTSTSLETPEGDWAWRFTTVIRSDRSWRDTRHSRCSRSSWQRAGEGRREDNGLGPQELQSRAHRVTKYNALNEHQTPTRLPWPLPQNFNPAVTQEPQIKPQYWGLSSFPMTPGWEAEPI